jgi:hypothetical protein
MDHVREAQNELQPQTHPVPEGPIRLGSESLNRANGTLVSGPIVPAFHVLLLTSLESNGGEEPSVPTLQVGGVHGCEGDRGGNVWESQE